jgi:hypothetical protein
MVVGDHERDAAGEAASAQAQQEVLPGGAALAVGHLDGQDPAPAVPIDAHGDADGLACEDAALAPLLAAGVEDQVRVGLGAPASGEGGEAVVQALVDGGDRRGREGMAVRWTALPSSPR